jgi:transcriptional regulator with XRE-family HTH domain
MTFEELKIFRLRLKISQEKMAKRIGVTQSFYQKIEQGRAQASTGFIRKFKKAFPEVSTDMFYTESR